MDRQAFLACHADVAAELGPLLEAGERIEALTRPVRIALEGRAAAAVSAAGGV